MLRAALFLLALSLAFACAESPHPPAQPETGPGGADYAFPVIRETRRGSGGEEFWLFEPQPAPRGKAPLIIFLHGYSVMEPQGYFAWIQHLVRRGNVVIYPRYQAGLFTKPAEFHPNALAAVRAALEILGERGRVAVDRERVAVVGHSAGGVLALRYCAAAKGENLPVPKAAVIVQPGQGPRNGVRVLDLPTTEELPADLRLVVAVGDRDSIVGDESARRIWRDTAGLAHRLFVTVQTDLHGEPRLRAGHLSPLSVEHDLADALDFLGWWRLLDVACAAAFSDQPLRLDPAMGEWSDGKAVRPLRIEGR